MSPSTCSACGATVDNNANDADLNAIVGATPWTLVRCQQLATTNEVLDKEIVALEDRLEHLKAERAQLYKYRSDNVSILSPLRRMPPVVLAEIFSWSLPATHEMRGHACDVKESPWTLAQVCRRWRQVALSTPSLWSTIIAPYDTGKVPEPAMIRTQVERARRSLRIYFYGSEDVDSTSQLELLQFLSEHSAHWEVLIIRVTAPLAPLLAALRGRLPSLWKLRLEWDKPDNPNRVHPIKCFETASSLRNVTIHHNFPFMAVPFPSHRLTTYRFSGSWETHQGFLRNAPGLLEARLEVVCDDVEVWPEPSELAITLPHLQRLHVTRVEALNYLRTPQLSEVGVWIKEPGSLIATLDAFLHRSSCTPHRLCIEGLPHAPTTVEIPKKYPFITSLIIIYGFKGSRAVAGLDAHLSMLSEENPPAFSHLTEICFGLSKTVPVDYPLFLKMLQCRRRTVGRCALTTAAFLTLGGPDPDPVTLAGLDDLSKGGLRLSLGSDREVQRTFFRWTCCIDHLDM